MAEWPYNTQRWQRLRRAKLSAEPLCEVCQQGGRLIPANTVDHNVAINDGGDPFPPLDGLTSMCAPCHTRKTSHVEVHRQGRVPTKGVDPKTGRPVDPDHWWNK